MGVVRWGNGRQRIGGVLLTCVLIVLLGATGSVAGERGVEIDTDTNTTDTNLTDTNLTDTNTTDTNLTDTTSPSSTESDGALEELEDQQPVTETTLDGSAETLDDTIDAVESTTTLADTGDSVESVLDGGVTPTPIATATPARSVSGEESETSPGTAQSSSNHSSHLVRSGIGTDVPSGPAVGAAAVGLGAVVAGVAARRLAGTPGVLRTPARVTSRGLGRWTRWFAPFRYSKHDESDPLDHEKREAVFEAVDDSPGVYLAELSDRLDLTRSTLRHHVRVLEHEDLIAAAKVRGYRRFYPAHTDEIELAAAMNDEATAPIVDALARLGEASVSALADTVDRDVSTVTYHLGRLEEDGVVVRERDGRAMVNRLAPEARGALIPLDDGDTAPTAADNEALLTAD